MKSTNPETYDLLEKHYRLLCNSRIGNIAIAAAITAYSRCDKNDIEKEYKLINHVLP